MASVTSGSSGLKFDPNTCRRDGNATSHVSEYGPPFEHPQPSPRQVTSDPNTTQCVDRAIRSSPVKTSVYSHVLYHTFPAFDWSHQRLVFFRAPITLCVRTLTPERVPSGPTSSLWKFHLLHHDDEAGWPHLHQ